MPSVSRLLSDSRLQAACSDVTQASGGSLPRPPPSCGLYVTDDVHAASMPFACELKPAKGCCGVPWCEG